MQPAIRHATRGFTVTPYLSDCIKDAAPDLVQDPFAADRPARISAPPRGGNKISYTPTSC
jgi:gamma-glutamyltranspeptidase/glutathione hydrolase